MLTNTLFTVAEAPVREFSPEEVAKTVEAAAVYKSLVGESVNDAAVAECLNELELKWLERFEVEESKGKTTTPPDKYQVGAAQQYKRFADRVGELRDNLQRSKVAGLDGFWSRELSETLETAETVLKAKADATGEPVNLSGLEDYRDKVDAHWKEVLTRNSSIVKTD